MAFRIVETSTRPSTDINWYQFPEDEIKHMAMLVAEKKLDMWSTSTPDLLSETWTLTYTNKEDMDAVNKNPALIANSVARNDYNLKHGITLSLEEIQLYR
jgi:hypothetical protein